MSNDLAPVLLAMRDPSELGFPALLPVELALRVAPVSEICAAYGIDRDEFKALAEDPLFVRAYSDACDELKKDGMSFRVKAKLQAEELLKESWKLIKNPGTPSNVKADLIKATVRWAGYEPKNVEGVGGLGNAFQININLG